MLVRVAARNFPEVLQQLFRCLIEGWMMEQSKGPELLEHFFATLPYSCWSVCNVATHNSPGGRHTYCYWWGFF